MGLFKPLAKRRAMMRVVVIAALAVLTRPACAINSGDLDCELMGETGAMSFTFAPVSRSADGRWGTMLPRNIGGVQGRTGANPARSAPGLDSVENQGRRRPMVANQPWLAHT